MPDDKQFTTLPDSGKPETPHNPNHQATVELTAVTTDYVKNVHQLAYALKQSMVGPLPTLEADSVALAAEDSGLCELLAIGRQSLIDCLTWQAVTS